MPGSSTHLKRILVGPALCCLTLYAQVEEFESGRKLQQAGRFHEAERYYRLALKASPRFVPALANLGIVLARQGRYTDAITAYQSALRIDPSALPVKLNLAIANIQTGNCTEALVLLRAVVTSEPQNRQGRQLLAICELETGRFTEAVKSFEALLPSSDVSILLGTATAYLKVGRLAEGKALLDTLLHQHGNAPELQLALGLAAFGTDEYSAARTAFENAIRGDPKSSDAHFYLGLIHFRENGLDSAVQSWREAIRLNPNHFGALLALGAFLAKQGDAAEAEPLLLRAGNMRPDIPAVQLELGKLALRRSALPEARRYFTAALERDPKMKSASYLLATTLKRMGLQQEAEAEFARSRKLYTNDDTDLLGIAVQGFSSRSSERHSAEFPQR